VRTRIVRRRKYDLRVRTRPGRAFPVVVGSVLLAAAALMLVVRLPAAFHSFSSGAAAAAGRNGLNGALATADAVGLDDNFVVAAFADIPKTARFVVVLPRDQAKAESVDSVNPITFAAAPAFFVDFLLPRRNAEHITRGVYIVCVDCKSPYWDKRTRWLSPDNGGGLIGLIDR
jgi:hypothetical protein